jgi:hypothetical protein
MGPSGPLPKGVIMRHKVSSREFRNIDEDDRNKLKGEVLMGLAKIKCHSLYDQPSHKIADNHRHKYGLCCHCEHFQCAAAESIILMAKCKEIKVGLTSAKPITECSWFIDDRAPTDASDFMHTATIMDLIEDKSTGFI